MAAHLRSSLLWSLYRPLLQQCSSPASSVLSSSTSALNMSHSALLKEYVRRGFQRAQRLKGHKARLAQAEGEELLHTLQSASAGSSWHAKQLSQLTSHLRAVSALAHAAPSPQLPAKPSPILTPGILFATPYHPPLPRIKPMPQKTASMIHKRRKAIQRRWDRAEVAEVWEKDARMMSWEEQALGVEAGGAKAGKTDADSGWGWEWRGWLKECRAKARREARRSRIRIPEKMQRKATAQGKRRGAWAAAAGERREAAARVERGG